VREKGTTVLAVSLAAMIIQIDPSSDGSTKEISLGNKSLFFIFCVWDDHPNPNGAILESPCKSQIVLSQLLLAHVPS